MSLTKWLSRRYNQVRAFFGGYFWLPCPICGKDFGGHERGGTLATSPSSGVMTCPDCAEEARRRSLAQHEQWKKDWTLHKLEEEFQEVLTALQHGSLKCVAEPMSLSTWRSRLYRGQRTDLQGGDTEA